MDLQNMVLYIQNQVKGYCMNESSLAFTVYMIHELANARNLSPGEVYRALKDSGCIDQYLVPHYEVLHTMGTQYLMNDITQYVSSRGGVL